MFVHGVSAQGYHHGIARKQEKNIHAIYAKFGKCQLENGAIPFYGGELGPPFGVVG